MKRVLLVSLTVFVALGGEPKPLPNQAGNDDVELVGTVILDRDECTKVLGADLGQGYVMVRIKVSPKTDDGIEVSPDHFTILSRKNGDRSQALSPFQIAGRGAMVLKRAATQPGGLGTESNGPVWGGIGGAPRRLPGNGGGLGNSGGAESGTVEGKMDTEKGAKENPLLAILKQKVLIEGKIKQPVEGLLYFTLDGKLKPKDVSLLYKGAGGRLVMDFK